MQRHNDKSVSVQYDPLTTHHTESRFDYDWRATDPHTYIYCNGSEIVLQRVVLNHLTIKYNLYKLA